MAEDAAETSETVPRAEAQAAVGAAFTPFEAAFEYWSRMFCISYMFWRGSRESNVDIRIHCVCVCVLTHFPLIIASRSTAIFNQMTDLGERPASLAPETTNPYEVPAETAEMEEEEEEEMDPMEDKESVVLREQDNNVMGTHE